MKKAAIGFMALILAGVVAFAAASVTGTWEMSYTTQRGETQAGHHFHADRREPGPSLDDACLAAGRATLS